MGTGNARDGDGHVQAPSARIRVTDDREHVVAADARERNERHAIPKRRVHEAIAAAPKEPIAELARLHGLAQPSWQDEHELAGGKESVYVLWRTVDHADGGRETSEHRYSPPEVLAERPDRPPRARADPRDGESDVPSECVIRDEESTTVR